MEIRRACGEKNSESREESPSAYVEHFYPRVFCQAEEFGYCTAETRSTPRKGFYQVGSELYELCTTIVQSFRGSRKFSNNDPDISVKERIFTAETLSTPRKEFIK